MVFINMLEAIEDPYEILEGDGLAKELGIHYYKHAIYTPNNILANPAALVVVIWASVKMADGLIT